MGEIGIKNFIQLWFSMLIRQSCSNIQQGVQHKSGVQGDIMNGNIDFGIIST